MRTLICALIFTVICVLALACVPGCSSSSATRDQEYQKVADLEAKMRAIIEAAHAFDVASRSPPATQPAVK